MLDPALASQGEQGRARGLIDAMNAIAAHAGIPRTLREIGVRPADLPTLATDAMRQERLLVNNPCAISEGDAWRIYEAAL